MESPTGKSSAGIAWTVGPLCAGALLAVVLPIQRGLVSMLAVPLLLFGLHFRGSWQARGQRIYLALSAFAAAAFARNLVGMARFNLRHPREWDFLGFWLHGRSAVNGFDFYDPRHATAAASGIQVSDEFRREILDVGFWYPPPSMFLFGPLGWFERETALYVWYALNGAFLAAAIFLLFRSSFRERRLEELLACAALIAGTHGAFLTVEYAQTCFAGLLALVGFWYARGEALRGVCLCLAVFVKPVFAVLLLPLVLTRSWRAIVAYAVTTASLFGAATVAFGASVTRSYFLGPHFSSKPSWIYDQPTNQSLLGLGLRLTDNQCGGADCLTLPYFAIPVLVMGAITLLVALRFRALPPAWSFALFLPFGLAIYPVSQVFYSVFLMPAIFLLWSVRDLYKGGVFWMILLAGTIHGLCLMDNGHHTVFAYLLLWGATIAVGEALVRAAESSRVGAVAWRRSAPDLGS